MYSRSDNPILIVDFDGTISLRQDRDPFEWSRLLQDRPNANVIWLLRVARDAGAKIVIVTGREERLRGASEAWLKLHLGFCPDMFMRTDGDTRMDAVVKKEIFENSISSLAGSFLVLDDRNQTVGMWRKVLGLQVFQVADGDF